MNNNIEVTVQCLAYNHEKYIRKALDGIAKQKTNFNYEVIIHDDASNDKTAEIIREFVAKHSNFYAVYQSENQYRKGLTNIYKCIYPMFKGKYIAFCEADDYWTDENKLQILYDYMIKHKDCSMCCHGYVNIDATTEKEICTVRSLNNDGNISMNDAIMFKNPPQLASQMFKKECIVDRPSIYYNASVGDYMMLLYAATVGELHYIDKIMAKHRIASSSSWTSTVFRNREKRKKHDIEIMDFLNNFDNETKFKYHEIISKRILEYDFDLCVMENNYLKQIKHKCFKSLNKKKKILIIIGCVLPNIATYVENKYYEFV